MRRLRRRASFAALVVPIVTASSLVALTPASAAKAKKSPTITVLVTNDDGVGAPGIDTLVEALRKQKNTKVVVVAPAANNSSTGGSTTPGVLVTRPATTASGYQATAVEGFPADTVVAALDQLGVKPNVVMSGINDGPNFSTLIDLSGTIGAARKAAERGIPALALSQDNRGSRQFSATAKLAVKWLAQHRKALAKKPNAAPTTITSYNVPNCAPGQLRGTLEVTTAPDLSNYTVPLDCAATGPKPTTDVDAYNAGYAAVTQVGLN